MVSLWLMCFFPMFLSHATGSSEVAPTSPFGTLVAGAVSWYPAAGIQWVWEKHPIAWALINLYHRDLLVIQWCFNGDLMGYNGIISGWWWLEHVLFFHSGGNVSIPIDELILFRGVGLNHQPGVYCLPIRECAPSLVNIFLERMVMDSVCARCDLQVYSRAWSSSTPAYPDWLVDVFMIYQKKVSCAMFFGLMLIKNDL